MTNLEKDLAKYGITDAKEILHNPSYEVLFADETNPANTGYDVGQVTELGAVNVMTGIYTGRSPKDKFWIKDSVTEDTLWWTSDEYKNDNKPLPQSTWVELKKIAGTQLSKMKLYVMDSYSGVQIFA